MSYEGTIGGFMKDREQSEIVMNAKYVDSLAGLRAWVDGKLDGYEAEPAAGVRKAVAPSGDLMTEDEVMFQLGVSRQWLKDHRTRVHPIIPHVKLGRTIRYPRQQVTEWMRGLVESRPRWERNGSK